MADINCPHRHRWISKVSRSVTLENRVVTIFDDVCDHCEFCGYRQCEYFDDSMEGTKRFNRGLARLHGSIQDQTAEKDYETRLRAKHRPASNS